MLRDRLVSRPVLGATAVLTALALVPSLGARQAAAGGLRQSEWALTTLRVDQLWHHSKGAGVTVAVVGTGVDAMHPDLAGRVTEGADFGNDGAGATQDASTGGGEGTHVASIIAADGRNYRGYGLYGIAPAAHIMPLNVLRNSSPSVQASATAIRYATRHGAKVIDVAVSFRSPDAGLRSAVAYAVHRDVVVVAGAGDDGATTDLPTYPAAFPGVVSVSAVDRHGHLWPSSYHGKAVTLAAPGVNILSAAGDGSYWTGSGTLFAAPWVAGSAALLRSAHPTWSASDVVKKLTASADRGARSDPRPGSAHRRARSDPRPGYGYGVVDPTHALATHHHPKASRHSGH